MPAAATKKTRATAATAVAAPVPPPLLCSASPAVHENATEGAWAGPDCASEPAAAIIALAPSKKFTAAPAPIGGLGTTFKPARVKAGNAAVAAGASAGSRSTSAVRGPARVNVHEATSSVTFERAAAAEKERLRSWRS
jgi:hypothetical protein